MPLSLVYKLFGNDGARARLALETLQIAADQRAHFDLFIHWPPKGPPATRLSLRNVVTGQLHYAADGRSRITTSWCGKQVWVRFILRTSACPQGECYVFNSEMLDIRAGERRPTLVLEVPKRLDEVSQRNNVRICVPERYMPSLRVWLLNAQASVDGIDLGALGSPVLEIAPDRLGNVLLHNLSAGGARISFKGDRNRKAASYLQGERRILVWLALPELAREKGHRFLLYSRIARRTELERSRVDVGMHFLQAGVRDSAGGLVWQDVAKDGVETLATWINRRSKDRVGVKSDG